MSYVKLGEFKCISNPYSRGAYVYYELLVIDNDKPVQLLFTPSLLEKNLRGTPQEDIGIVGTCPECSYWKSIRCITEDGQEVHVSMTPNDFNIAKERAERMSELCSPYLLPDKPKGFLSWIKKIFFW